MSGTVPRRTEGPDQLDRTRPAPHHRQSCRAPGVAIAGITALISGVSVAVNGIGVRHIASSAVYTTGKNAVAVVLLGVGAVAGAVLGRRAASGIPGAIARWTEPPPAGDRSGNRSRLGVAAGFAYVGVVGGGVAFLLFFDGLARTPAASAAFVRDTMVVWVAALAVPFLHERPRPANLVAVALLVGGQVAMGGGFGALAGVPGLMLVLAATMLWAIEVVVASTLLATVSPAAVALVRMGLGTAVLFGSLAVTGHLTDLARLTAAQIGWLLLTGVLLAGYVATWMAALARARAIDVTSVLVTSALVTAALAPVTGGSIGGIGGAAGGVMIASGALVVVLAWPRTRPRTGAP